MAEVVHFEAADFVHFLATTCETVLFNGSLQATLPVLCRAIAKIVSCDRASVFLLDGDRFRGSANFGNPPQLDEQFVTSDIPEDAPIVHALRRRQQPVSITNRATSALAPLPPAVAADVKSLVVAPVRDRGGSLIGLLTAEDHDADGFLPLESEIVGATAHLVALAVMLERRDARSFDMRPGHMAALSGNGASALAGLSHRESEVLELIARGHTNEEAARHLGLSVRTIESHRAALMSKLGASTRADLVRAAEAAGVLVFPDPGTDR